MKPSGERRIVSLRMRGVRAGLYAATVALFSAAVGFVVFSGLGNGDTTGWYVVAGPFVLGALAIIVPVALGNDDMNKRFVASRGALAAVVGAVTAGALLGSFALFVSPLVLLVAIAPMIVGALVARWVELRACRAWSSRHPSAIA